MTKSWISNALFSSSDDMIKFLSVLLRNGTYDGKTKIISKSMVDLIFSPHFRPKHALGHCAGVHEYGLGVGHCIMREPFETYAFPQFFNSEKSKTVSHPTASLCLSEDTWMWSSSHGSRFTILRDQGIGCYVSLNQPLERSINTRSHFLGHNMSAILREVFPVTRT